ncbi:gluconate 5-dehydrogenase [Yersinia pseudotuberculosis]|nr:gluconate 5-dehydrogenase [Yersinia pseudotuberculosis]AYX13179.1 gluconate 5-dehydrogenase [Yersinia pseudotuberculosis]MBO1565829.1 gluconate 5-dehydrogenase [Yersinia pseudotuberculosis]MBO1602791.1 gluconate 5-dehydrogenase [Yersinia pseudotuberculosis]PEI13063.1 gluconate 5-dehydrogenase [Yersinia pseudotuberculosis]
MDVFTASLRSACFLRRGHFVNNLKRPFSGRFSLSFSL